jgi:hypothetical protein
MKSTFRRACAFLAALLLINLSTSQSTSQSTGPSATPRDAALTQDDRQAKTSDTGPARDKAGSASSLPPGGASIDAPLTGQSATPRDAALTQDDRQAETSDTGLAGDKAGSASSLPPGGASIDDPLTGPRSQLPKDWAGLRLVPADTPILVMAGHADSQQIKGAGTPGAAVAINGEPPMEPGITDELYWNIAVAKAVVELGQKRCLRIRYYEPKERTIIDEDAPGTNWSVGKAHAAAGGYALEIHFDAYGPDGIGSGLIPPLTRPFSRLDESLASTFGAYPKGFRGELGGPKRGIALLEIGKLEGTLEANLRDPASSQVTVQAIAERVVGALQKGLEPPAKPCVVQ